VRERVTAVPAATTLLPTQAQSGATKAPLLKGLIFLPAGAWHHPAVLFLHGSGQDCTREVAAVGPLYAGGGHILCGFH
jgi:hypothetical protein